MKHFVIFLFSLITFPAFSQQDADKFFNKIKETNPASITSEIKGLWKLSVAVNTVDNPGTLKQILITDTEFIFCLKDSITRRTNFKITSESTSNGKSNSHNYSITFADNEEWNFSLFIDNKNSRHINTLFVNLDPTCFCTCPYEIYTRVFNPFYVIK